MADEHSNQIKLNKRARLRELGISIGRFQPGPYNAITDVPGVLVGQKTIIRDEPAIVRTGVTVIMPRNGLVHEDFPFAGFSSFNGIGEMTGLHLIEEWGLLTTPIVLTNTNEIGIASTALSRYGAKKYGGFAYKLPVVAETYDGYLNDIDSFAIREDDVVEAIEAARSGPVSEGNCGGGTGMICYEYKGGTGSSSRQVEIDGETYSIGALVQANHGIRPLLRINGVPVGLILGSTQFIPGGYEQLPVESSSIIVIIATDAPLLADQCKRLARRATVGLARTGGVGYNTSGDIFLAFSTGNHYRPEIQSKIPLQMLHQSQFDPIIEATAEAVEESILNALTMAETMTGYLGHTIEAVPLDEVRRLVTGRFTV